MRRLHITIKKGKITYFNLLDLGIYQRPIWTQITKSLLQGDMDEEIAKLKEVVKDDSERYKELVERRRRQIKIETEYFEELEKLYSFGLNISGTEENKNKR